jgi:hypothetical protein
MRFLSRIGGVLLAMGAVAPSLWAHPSTSPHVHANEVVGLVVVSLIVLAMLAPTARKER